MVKEIRVIRGFTVNKLAIKIGLLFFSIILIVETCLFLFLYRNLVNTRVEEELNALQIRGTATVMSLRNTVMKQQWSMLFSWNRKLIRTFC